MSFYSEHLTKNLQEKIAFFHNAGLSKEAELLQARLNAMSKNDVENCRDAINRTQDNLAECPITAAARKNLRTKLNAETHHIPNLEKQYILENLGNAKTLNELEPLRVAYIERLLKISRANRSEKIVPAFGENVKTGTGPYNNNKTLSEALQLIYSQDPLWIEDLKELYFSIMPLSSAAAVSKSPL
jgi:hypothetical protein